MSSPSHVGGEPGWARFTASYRVGDIIDAEVVQVVPFGSFVRVDEGVDGLAPQVSWPQLPQLGTRVRARILAIDDRNRRFSVAPV